MRTLDGGDRDLGEGEVFFASGRANADGTDDMAVDDNRQSAEQVHALPLARHLKFDLVRNVPKPGGLPERRCRPCLGDGGIDGLSISPIHAGEGQQMAARINDGNAFGHTIQRRLFNSLIKNLKGPFIC